MDLVEIIGKSDQFQKWVKALAPHSKQLITGVLGSAKTLMISSLYEERKGKVMIIVPNLYYANHLLEDLQHLISEEELYLFPADEVTVAEMSFSSPESIADRVRTLSFLTSKRSGVVVVPVAGARKYLPDPKFWQSSEIKMTVGDELDLGELVKKLTHVGYVRCGMVSKPGDFSIRGGIVDIYPLDFYYPVRLDFFDTVIDSIRYFEVNSQRSLEVLDEVRIIPATDMIYTPENIEMGTKQVEEALNKHVVTIKKEEDKADFTSYMESLLSEWHEGRVAENTRWFNYFFYQKKFSLLDYLEESGVLIVDDYTRLVETEKELLKDEAQWVVQKMLENKMVPMDELAADFRNILKRSPQAQTFFSLFQKGLGRMKFTQEVAIQ